MALKQTAIVVVSKAWMDTGGVRLLVNDGRKSQSSDDTHIVVAPLDDSSDQLGLWLQGITTTQMTEDGSPLTMRLMIPWSFIVALGIVDGEKETLGFQTNETVVSRTQG